MISTPKRSMDKTIFFIGPLHGKIYYILFLIYRPDAFRTSKLLPSLPKSLIEALKFALNTYPYSYHPNEKLTYVYYLYVYANKIKLLLYYA